MEEISKGLRVIKILKHVGEAIKQNTHGHFRELNITGPQGMLIGTLAHFGEMKVSDLSEKLGLSNSTVSGILDRLETQGLVERTRSKEDRRVVYVNVTPEFKKNSQERFKKVEKAFEDIMKKATPEELDIIFQGLDTLQKVIDRHKQ